MSKKTLMTDFRPLQDKGKDDFFVKEGNKYYVEGYEVMLDDTVTLHEAYLGDFSMYVGKLTTEGSPIMFDGLTKKSIDEIS